MTNGKWYLGAMNDGLFIIDRPPKPVPVDYLTAGDPDLNVIVAMGNDKIRAKAIVAAHNAIVEHYTTLKKRARVRALELAEGLE